MDNINNINNENEPSIWEKYKIPDEVSLMILSYLKKKEDISNARLVCRDWSELMINSISHSESSKISNFISQFIKLVDEEKYGEQIQFLIENTVEKEILGSVTFQDFKTSYGKVEEEICNVLSVMDMFEIRTIIQYFKLKLIPGKLHFIFERAYHQKHLKQILQNPNPEYKEENLLFVAEKLAQTGDFQKAFEVADLVSDSYDKEKVIERIKIIELVDSDVDAAMEVVNDLGNPEWLIRDISYYLADCGHLEIALDVAVKLSDNGYYKKGPINKIMQQYVIRNQFDQVLKLMESYNDCKSSGYRFMATCYALQNRLDEAKETLDLISDEFEKAFSYQTLIDDLVSWKELEIAQSFIEKLPNGDLKQTLLAKLPKNKVD